MSVPRHANTHAGENIPVDPHQACTRFGDILLEIFSKGKSVSMKVSHADLGNNGLCQDESDDEDVTMPSMAKRLAYMSLANCDSISDRAKRLSAE